MHYAYIYIYRINQIGNESAKLTSMKKTLIIILSKSIHPSISHFLKLKIMVLVLVLIPCDVHIKYQTGGTKPRISRCGRTKGIKEKITSLALALALQGKLP